MQDKLQQNYTETFFPNRQVLIPVPGVTSILHMLVFPCSDIPDSTNQLITSDFGVEPGVLYSGGSRPVQ